MDRSQALAPVTRTVHRLLLHLHIRLSLFEMQAQQASSSCELHMAVVQDFARSVATDTPVALDSDEASTPHMNRYETLRAHGKR